MTCRSREPELLLHAHGELRGGERQRLEVHLHGCDRCRAEWESYAVEALLLRSTLGVPADAAAGRRIFTGVAGRIRASRQEQFPFPQRLAGPLLLPLFRMRLAAGLLAAAILAAVWLGSTGRLRWVGERPGRRRHCREIQSPLNTPPASEALRSSGATWLAPPRGSTPR